MHPSSLRSVETVASGPSASGVSRPERRLTYLTGAEWRAAQAEHEARADRYLGPHLGRRRKGEKHAVEDFLFEYYRFRPGHLRRWHPGAGVTLLDPDDDLHTTWRFYAPVPRHGDEPHRLDPTTGRAAEHAAEVSAALPIECAGSRKHATDLPREARTPTVTSAVTVDVGAFLAAKRDLVAHVQRLLRAIASRPGAFGCFGLHEWAMVYRAADDRRHPAPLRLGATGTDEVVDSMQLRCTHYDAFRFFMPEAVPRNEFAPTRATQVELDQPGCLHAGMDLYRFAAELMPAVDSDLVMDCFEHAMRARYLDMRASPYDLAHLGLAPIRIETTAGRAEYVAAQRELAGAAASLRGRLIKRCEALLARESGDTEPTSP